MKTAAPTKSQSGADAGEGLARRKMKYTLLGVALAVIGAVGCSGGKGRGSGSAVGESDHPLVGAKAPDFDLKVQNGGGRISSSELQGKVGIIDFWATWCEPCKESFPHYQAMVDQHGGKVVVVGISVDEDPSGIAAFGKSTGAKFPLAWDDGQTLAGAYEPSTMPTSFIVDTNGIVRFVHAGFKSGDEQTIASQVTSLLP